jgi:hypothetical protein
MNGTDEDRMKRFCVSILVVGGGLSHLPGLAKLFEER